MKTRSVFATTFVVTTCLATTLFSTTSCDREKDLISPLTTPASDEASQTNTDDKTTIQFDRALFSAKVDAYLKSQNLAGYGYSILVNGQFYAGGNGGSGWARKPIDAPSLAHQASVPQELASSSKFITALAVGRALELSGLTLDHKIWPYVPTYMAPTPGFKTITFRQLLSHHAGVKNYGSANDADNGHLTDMKRTIEDGIDATTYDKYAYSNMGYALCRVLIPYIVWHRIQKLSLADIQAKEANRNQLDYTLAECFLEFVRTHVYRRAQLKDWNVRGAGSATLYYSDNDPAKAGAPSTIDIRNLGPGGFDLSASELAQVVTAARFSLIVSATTFAQFKAGYKGAELGYDNFMAGKYGKYYTKNGGAGGVETIMVDFDGPQANVQVGVVANSTNGTVNTGGWLRDAFDASWK